MMRIRSVEYVDVELRVRILFEESFTESLDDLGPRANSRAYIALLIEPHLERVGDLIHRR